MRTRASVAGWPLVLATLLLLAGCHRLALPADTPSSRIALKSAHGRYVTALDVGDGWTLRQNGSPGTGECSLFTRYSLGHDLLGHSKIALMTCYGRYVTAPRRGSTREDWQLWQDSGLGDCGQFLLIPQAGGFALQTCAGRYLTAGDGNWPSPLQWSLVAETEQIEAWEIFTMEAVSR